MNTAIEDGDRPRELILEGALVIQRAAEVKEELRMALDGVDSLILNFGETTEIDLSCLQLICSAHRAAAGLNKTLTWVGQPIGKGILRDVGVSDSRGCPSACGQGCVWT